MCTASQVIQASMPLSWTPLMSATARARPLSRGCLCRHSETAGPLAAEACADERAAWRPCCIATVASPGRASAARRRAPHHIAQGDHLVAAVNREPGPDRDPSGAVELGAGGCGEHSGELGCDHARRPDDGARRRARQRPAGALHVTDSASMCVTVVPSITVTPSRSSARAALAERRGGNAPSTRSVASQQDAGSADVRRAELARQRVTRKLGDRPAISTPSGRR